MLSPVRSAWVYKRLNSTGTLIQRTNHGGSSRNIMYYIGLDVHKKTISYCAKDASGQVHQEGKIGATRRELDSWIKTLPQPRTMAKGGVTSYLEVITAQSAALTDEVTAVNILGRRMANTVLLIQALGGGWDRSSLPDRPECCGRLASSTGSK